MTLCKGEKAVDEVLEAMLIARRLITMCLPFSVSKLCNVDF